MNENSKKKRNTALFMLVATLVNIVLMTVFMLIGYLLLVLFANPDKPEAGQIWLIAIFIGSIILAWFVYSRMVKWYTKRVDVNEKFAPLITPRQPKKRNQADADESEMKR